MEKGLILEVKKKKEFSGLPDSIVVRALEKSRGDVKIARSWLRKYFGVFLTNRVLRGKGDLLKVHLSSKKRDYEEFYFKIFNSIFPQKSKESSTHLSSCGGLKSKESGNKIESIVDLGCGVNGFSYEYLKDVFGTQNRHDSGEPDVRYVGMEAAGQLVEQMNGFFKERGFDALAIKGDLFDLESVEDILKRARKDRVVFLFQVIDALESVERNFSKKLISVVMENCEWLVISLPLVSLGGRKRFDVDRKWLVDWLGERFGIRDDFEMFGERVICVRK